MSRIAILGAGSLGTALAIALHKRDRTIYLWTIEPDVVHTLKRSHENTKYLPGFPVPTATHATTVIEEALEDIDAAVLAVPSFAVREVIRAAVPYLPESAILASAAKGLEEGTWLRMSQVIGQELPPDLPVPVVTISGPSLSTEMAHRSTAGLDAACEDLDAARRLRQHLGTSLFRLRPTNDVAGVEAGGTFKNAYAIGMGIGDGFGWGMNERSVYLTKAIAEIARLATALGGKRSTVYGLSGLGDLAVTSFSPHSRNRMLGEDLARGRSLREVLQSLVSVAEGVPAASAAHAIAAQHHLRLPIAVALHQILHDGADPKSLQRAVTSAR